MPKPETSQKKNEVIQFRIIEIKKLNHFENDPDELEISRDRLKEPVEFEIAAAIGINPEIEIIALRAHSFFFIKENNEKIKLFGLSAVYKFHVMDLKKKFLKDNTIDIPQNLLVLFANFIISGMRGMLAVLNTRPEYSNIIIPAIDPSSIVKQHSKISEKQSKQVSA